MHEGAGGGVPGRGRGTGPVRVALGLLVTFLVTGAAAVAVPLLRAGPATSGAAGDGVRAGGHGAPASVPAPAAGTPAGVSLAVACALVPASGASRGDEHCHRIAEDTFRRARLTDGQRRAGERHRDAVRRAIPVRTDTECPAVSPSEPCGLVYVVPRADRVERALVAAGYAGTIARVARPDDPAPAGAVLYAVPVETACLLAYLLPSDGYGEVRVEGRLPDGTCLPA